MNDKLLRTHIRMVHRQIHLLRREPEHPIHFELIKMYETNLADLTYARSELKRIALRRQS